MAGTHGDEELDARVRALLASPGNLQEFADLVSDDATWARVDKSIALPRHVGFSETACPACGGTLRILTDKFSMADYEAPLVCPHCRAALKVVGEFAGYTTEARVERA